MKVGYAEAIVHKMPVKGEGFRDLSRLHDFKTETINQTYISPVLGRQALYSQPMPLGICPYYFQERDNLGIEIMNWSQANAPLQKGYSFHEDIRAGQELNPSFSEVSKILLGPDMH
jgi:hypothetical protein